MMWGEGGLRNTSIYLALSCADHLITIRAFMGKVYVGRGLQGGRPSKDRGNSNLDSDAFIPPAFFGPGVNQFNRV